MSKWLSFDTAPRDGTTILVLEGSLVWCAEYWGFDPEYPESKEAWVIFDWDGQVNVLTDDEEALPSHWMPMPELPE